MVTTPLPIAFGLALAAAAAGAGPADRPAPTAQAVQPTAVHAAVGAALVSSPPVRIAQPVQPAAMVRIDGGTFRPLYSQPGETTFAVATFELDERPVTRAEFEAFVRRNPRWQRGSAPALFVDEHYLHDWAAPSDAGDAVPRDYPVTNISWFAARSYCAERGARLPTTAEWEYVARADENDADAASTADFRRRALELSMQRKPRPVGSGFRNVHGVYDMHGAVMEWVSDFQSIFAGSDSRQTERRQREMTCAAGATTTGDASDYAAFLRYAFRGTVEGRSTTGALGFRCAGGV